MLLPVRITLMDGVLRPFTTRSIAYGSVLYAPGSEGREALRELLCAYRQGVDGVTLFTELRNLHSMEAVQPILRECGFAYEDNLNYLIDLNRSPEAILQSFGHHARKRIRQGLRQGKVAIEQVTDRTGLTECYDLLLRTFHLARVPLADRSLFDGAFEVLYGKRMARFCLARVDQVPAATSVELLYKDTMYGWYGGMNRAYGSYSPNELVMWDILQWGAQNGYRLYDFGGAGKPDEKYGVRDFKAKFGGQLVCYGRNTCVHAPLVLRLSKLGYGTYRRLFAHQRHP
jgi:predicted N-acyltransferase